MIRTSLDARGLPLVIEPESGCGGFEALLHDRRDFFSERLLEYGALLFRGFAEPDLAPFRRFVAAFSGSGTLFDYAGGASPRSALGGEKDGLYSSTEYPSSMGLSLHNELSYADLYPNRLFFFCLVAADEGGETTLGDSRRILRRIDAGILDTFRTRQVRYVRNLSPDRGSGYSWQDAFETDEPDLAERHCRRIGADFEWRDGGVLRLSQIRPATAFHPETGEEVWFNQADGFHPSALDPATYAVFLEQAGSEDGFRLNVTYGDGSPIEAETLAHIRAVLLEETVPHRWQPGDILVLDNLLAAHGRMPFSGPRKIALAMT
jgi:alpha-ketoglutarate-dependent taurine dioxygenase